MTEVTERYARVADRFGARLESVRADQFENPTPCTDWTVRQLAAHVITTHRRVLGSLHGGEAADADQDSALGPQWDSATGEVRAALADPDQSGKTISGMFGEQSFETLVSRLLCADLLMHTWDLSRATGQDEHLDPPAVTQALAFLTPIDDAIRPPGGFAAKIEPPPGADEQTALLNFCGRAP